MSDVELLNASNCRDGSDVFHGEPMSGVDGEPERPSEGGAVLQGRQCGGVRRVMGVGPGVQFDGIRAEFVRLADALVIRVNKETAADAGTFQPLDGLCQRCDVPHHVQSSFCSYFLTTFRDEGDLLRTESFGQRQHFVEGCTLEVEWGTNLPDEALNVGVLDVSAILAQVGGNAIGAGVFAEQGSVHGVRVGTAPRLSQRGHVVDVHEQPERRNRRIVGRVGSHYVRGHGRRGKSGVIHAGNAAEEVVVRKRMMWAGIVTLVLIGAGCSSGMRGGSGGNAPAPLTGATAGASSAKDAVEAFMRAVKAQDLQTMSAVWGTVRGPAREQIEREELEKRLVIIQCKLDHDAWEYADDRPRLLVGGKQDFRLRIRQKGLEAVTSFTTILAPSGRWFVEIVDLDPLRDFCG